MKVIGIKHFTGSFDGHAFDVYHLYCNPDNVYVAEGNAIYGNCPELFKVKADILHQSVSPDKIDKLLGRDIEILYAADKKTVAKVTVL